MSIARKLDSDVNGTPVDGEERRTNLRRLDDILEALERLNFNEQKVVPQWLVTHLRSLGVEAQANTPIASLIERVWELQRPFLVHLKVERRRFPRRQVAANYPVETVLTTAVHRLRQQR
ncbi:MAG: hypothetical protein ACYDAY_07230 [Candidatus Dormibacteria bacterium]